MKSCVHLEIFQVREGNLKSTAEGALKMWRLCAMVSTPKYRMKSPSPAFHRHNPFFLNGIVVNSEMQVLLMPVQPPNPSTERVQKCGKLGGFISTRSRAFVKLIVLNCPFGNKLFSNILLYISLREHFAPGKISLIPSYCED